MATIIRRKLSANFTVLPNEMLRDKRLSFKARGVLAMVLTNREDWNVTAGWLEGQGTEGRDAIRGALGELKKFGYVTFHRVGNAATGLTDCIWTFFDSAGNAAEDGKSSGSPTPSAADPCDPKPSNGSAAYLRRTIPEEELSKKEEPKKKKKEVSACADAVPETKTPSEHAVFIKQWTDEYLKAHGVPYSFNGGRDGKAVKKLLQGGLGTAVLIRTAVAAWSRLKSPFLRQRSVSLHGFADALNEIRNELCDLDKANRPFYAV
jgi:hypothetical protein